MDAGCGSGIFTLDILSAGAQVTGLDISLPMLKAARRKWIGPNLHLTLGDMLNLPFPAESFEKVVSVTALEFIEDGRTALKELFRVARKGGRIVVATLNSLSPWAVRRREEAQEGHDIFKKVTFRSPEELQTLSPIKGVIKTAIHFQKEADPPKAVVLEEEGRQRELNTGAFLAACWEKSAGEITAK